MKNLINKVIDSTPGKVTLGLIGINLLLGIYDIVKISIYLSTPITILITIVLLAILMLLILCASKYKKISIALNVLLTIILIIGCIALNKTSEFTSTITDTKEYETVEIMVLKESELYEDSDLNGLVMGASLDDSLGLERAREILEEHNKDGVRERLYDDMMEAYNDLVDGKIDMIVITTQTISFLEDDLGDVYEYLRSIFTKSYEITTDVVTEDIDILTEPFTVYLCGTDISGKTIGTASRSDANMLLTVNPNTKQVSLQIIPRDLYAYVESKDASTKLSWSGRYGGVTSSMKAIEHELGIDINYYAKINWYGLSDLVDALGGIDVYSHYDYSLRNFHYVKGMNHLNGNQALLMCTERKSLPNNELSRGLQQMEVLKGIINKVIQEPSFDNLMAVLNTIENNFMTNYPEEKFIDAFNLMVSMRAQLGDIDSYTMQGEYKWHYDEIKKGYYAYYYYPTEAEKEKVRDRINDVLLGR